MTSSSNAIPDDAPLETPDAGSEQERITRRQMLTRAAGIGLVGASFQRFGIPAPSTSANIGTTIAQAVQETEPVSGGKLRIVLQAEPDVLDPAQALAPATWKAVEHIYDTLVRMSPELAPISGLAQTWEINDDGTIYTFHIREDVLFHDGSPLTADDVLFTYTRILDPATRATNFVSFLSIKGGTAFQSGQVSTLEGIQVLDPLTLQITLEEPDASFLSVLSLGTSGILSRAFVEANNGDVSSVANGTGAFKLKGHFSGSSITYEKNSNYWEPGLPYLDAIEATFASDDFARSGSLIQGASDFIEYAPLRDIDTLSNSPGIHIAGNNLNNSRYVMINLTREPFTDLRVRQAIALAIDRAPIIEAALFGHGVAIDTLFAPSHWAGFDHEIPPPNLERARELLAEAGYPDGFSTTLITYSGFSFLVNAAIVLQEQLKQIGIEIDFTPIETTTAVQLLIQHDFDLAVASAVAWIDPHPVVLANFGSGQFGNVVSYSNSRVDELISEGKREIDRTARAAIYRELQEILLADLPWIPLYASNQYEAMKSNVRGFIHYPTGSNASLRETWIDQS
ncbi:ABC transporter substrate-binding protein [soil metagenome]